LIYCTISASLIYLKEFGNVAMNYSPNTVQVDLSALVHNLNQVKRLVGSMTKIMGIVKSDAYGHGALHVSEVLEKKGVHSLGVAHVHEALNLRKGGIRAPIVVLCGTTTGDEARAAVENGLMPVLFDRQQAEILNAEALRANRIARVFLKLDTGMGRLGIFIAELQGFLEKLRALRGLLLEGLFSHLSSADEPENDFTSSQIENFDRAIEIGRAMEFSLPLNNLANSAALIKYRQSHYDMVRPGIMLYGGLPSPELSASVSLRPVMHFKGKVIQVRDLPGSSPVSYGRTYYTKGRQRIAVVSAGYGDGLPRSLSNTGKVLVRGKRVPIVGTVCMNMVMADVSELEDVGPGEEVVFLGTQGREVITGDEVAAWSGTISYEIFCSLGQRNTREYL